MRYLKMAAVMMLVLMVAVTALAANCPACGADVDPDAEFCPACGAGLAPETKADDPEAKAKKLYDETMDAVKRSDDHEANVRMLETSAAKLMGTKQAGKLDELLAKEREAAKIQGEKARAALAALMESKKTADEAVAFVKRSRDYAENVTRLEKALAGVKGSRYEAEIKEILAEQKALLQKQMAAASVREKAERARSFNALNAKVRRGRDHKANIELLEAGLAKLKGTEFEARIKKMVDAQKSAMAAAAQAESEAAARKTYDTARAEARRTRDDAAKLALLETAAAKLKGTKYDGKLDAMIASAKAAIARTADAETQARAAAEAKAKADAEAKAAAAEKADEADQKSIYDEAIAAVKDSSDYAANIRTLETAAAKLTGTLYGVKLTTLVGEHRALLKRQEAKAGAADTAAARAKAKKIYDDLRAKVRASKDRARNVRTLEEGVRLLAGTGYQKQAQRLLDSERQLAEREAAAASAGEKAKAEAAARKTYDEARAAARRSRDHKANLTALEAAAAKLKGTSYDGRLDPMIAAEKRALATDLASLDAEKKATADAEARAQAEAARKAAAKIYNDARAATRRSTDRTKNVETLEAALARVKGTDYEARVQGMLDAEKKLLEREVAAAEAKKKADAEAGARAQAEAARKAAAKIYSDVRAAVGRSRDRSKNVKALQDAVASLKGTSYQARIQSMLDSEKKLLERELAAAAAKTRADEEAKARAEAEAKARAEAEAKAAAEAAEKAAEHKKAHDAVAASIKDSTDHAANIVALVKASAALRGTEYEAKIATLVAAERKAIEDEAAAGEAAEAEAALAAKKKTYDDVTAKVAASKNHVANIAEIEVAVARLKGTEFERKLKALIESEKQAIEADAATAEAETKARAEAAARKIFEDARESIKGAGDHAANIKKLEAAKPNLAGTAYEPKLAGLIAAEQKALDRQTAAEVAAAKAKAEAAAKKIYDDARAAARASKDHKGNIAALEAAAAKLLGTPYEGRLASNIAAEKKAVEREAATATAAEKARVEAAAKKVYDDVLAAVRRSDDHADNLGKLETAAPKLVGTRMAGALDSQMAAEKKALATQLAAGRERERAAAASKGLYDDLMAQVKGSNNYKKNVEALERGQKALAGSQYAAAIKKELDTQLALRAVALREEHQRVYQSAVAMTKRSSDHEENARILARAAEKVAGSKWESGLKKMAAAEAAKHRDLAEAKKREMDDRARREAEVAARAEEIQTAKVQKENTPEAVFNKAKGLVRSKPDEAIALFQTVMGMKDSRGRRHKLAKDAAYSIAELYSAQRKKEFDPLKAAKVRSANNWDLAARYYYAAFKLDPTRMSDGLYKAGSMYLKLRQMKKARLYFEKAAEECKDPGIARNALRAAARIRD